MTGWPQAAHGVVMIKLDFSLHGAWWSTVFLSYREIAFSQARQPDRADRADRAILGSSINPFNLVSPGMSFPNE